MDLSLLLGVMEAEMTACGKDHCRACEASEGRPEALDQYIAEAIRESQGAAARWPHLIAAGAWIVIITTLLVALLSR
jgi:hypothetical protein